MSSRSRSGRDEKNASSEGPGRLLNIFFADNGLSSTVQDRARLDRRVESGAYAPPAPRATSLRSAPISKRHRPRDSCAIDGRAERVSHRHPGRRSSHKTMWDGWHTGARRRGGANSNSMLKEFRPSPTRAPDRGGVFVRCGSPLADVHGHALFRTESQSFLGARALGLKKTDDSHRSCSPPSASRGSQRKRGSWLRDSGSRRKGRELQGLAAESGRARSRAGRPRCPDRRGCRQDRDAPAAERGRQENVADVRTEDGINRHHDGLAVPHDPPSLQGGRVSVGQAGVPRKILGRPRRPVARNIRGRGYKRASSRRKLASDQTRVV
jgi:hypothetical protein